MHNFKTITSLENKNIKRVASLAQKKYRHKYKEFTVENLKTIQDLAQAKIFPKEIYLSQDFFSKTNLEQALSQQVKTYLLSDKIFKKITNLETSAQVLAVYKIPTSKKFTNTINGNWIYLNNISDPGNLGSILRTASSFSFQQIVLDEKCVDLYNPKTVAAAKDSILKLNFWQDNSHKFLAKLSKNVKTLAADQHAQKHLHSIKPTKNMCLVLGSEADGLEKDVLLHVQESFSIKTTNYIESLNVSAAAAVAMHHFYAFS